MKNYKQKIDDLTNKGDAVALANEYIRMIDELYEATDSINMSLAMVDTTNRIDAAVNIDRAEKLEVCRDAIRKLNKMEVEVDNIEAVADAREALKD